MKRSRLTFGGTVSDDGEAVTGADAGRVASTTSTPEPEAPNRLAATNEPEPASATTNR